MHTYRAAGMGRGGMAPLLLHHALLSHLIVRKQANGAVLASYPGLPMFFNVHEKNWEGLVDFDDVMDVVYDDAHWNE